VIRIRLVIVVAAWVAATGRPGAATEPVAPDDLVRVATFDVDATPPVGAAMAYGPAVRGADLTLRCRGIALLGAGEPIVVAAIDWLGLGNEGHDDFRTALAAAAGTSPDRVAVQALHQHDAPYCDFTAGRLLQELGIPELSRFDGQFARGVIARASDAVRAALPLARPATHWGFGRAEVSGVASNRRLVGPDGRIRAWRGSTTRDPALRAEPEGTIDPTVAALVLWGGSTPLAVLTSYATHPMSYYLTGVPSPDFPGIARFLRTQDVPDALHVHFTGAGGNVAAGKYNDGSTANRVVFATRLAAGMRAAFEAAERRPLTAADVGWQSGTVRLEAAAEPEPEALVAAIRAERDKGMLSGWVERYAWVNRVRAGHAIPVSCLRVGSVRMLCLPGELFVEYQLAAREMRPDLDVMVAAYGDYAPVYIGTAAAYSEGGYETEPRSSGVGPQAEAALMQAMRDLLGSPDSR
jgi:hypothetical protein